MSGDTLATRGHHNVGSARVTLHLGSALLVWFLLASQSTVSLATRAFPRQYGRNFGLFTERSGLSDAAHVRNAIARFNQVEGESGADRDRAWRRILAAAKKFNVTVSEGDWRELKGRG
jgi:hypothetical protein